MDVSKVNLESTERLVRKIVNWMQIALFESLKLYQHQHLPILRLEPLLLQYKIYFLHFGHRYIICVQNVENKFY